MNHLYPPVALAANYRPGILIALVLLSLMARTLKAATPAAVAPRGAVVHRDLAYVANGDPAQILDLYLPEKPAEKPLPVLIYIHGGGWTGGNKLGCPVARWVTDGYAAVGLEYRFSTKALFPAQIQDCQAAIRWLRAHAKEYNLDANHIGVMGDSAGGHLVSLLGTAGGKNAFPPIGGNEEQSDRVQAVCDLYGPADFNTVVEQAAEDEKHGVHNVFQFNHGDPYSRLIGVPLGSDQSKTDAASPIHYVTKDVPPFLILHGTRDYAVSFAQSVELEAALRNLGVDVLFQHFPGAAHGGPVFHSEPVMALVKNFFDKHLRGMDVPVELIPEAQVTVTNAPTSHASRQTPAATP